MNPAEVATSLLIEKTLERSPAYRKVDDSLYVIKQGSAYVMISVVPWGSDKACVVPTYRANDCSNRSQKTLAFSYQPATTLSGGGVVRRTRVLRSRHMLKARSWQSL